MRRLRRTNVSCDGPAAAERPRAIFFAATATVPIVVTAGLRSKGAQLRRERLMRDLPRALQAEEARTFAAAKRQEAAGVPAEAQRLFGLSRTAFQAQEEIRRAQERGQGLDLALERGSQVLLRIANTA
jgi:hypothetical protein